MRGDPRACRSAEERSIPIADHTLFVVRRSVGLIFPGWLSVIQNLALTLSTTNLGSELIAFSVLSNIVVADCQTLAEFDSRCENDWQSSQPCTTLLNSSAESTRSHSAAPVLSSLISNFT